MHFVPAELSAPCSPLPFVAELPGDWDRWLAEDDTLERTPFLISPTFEYDVELNAFFLSAGMVGDAWNTQAGYARDVAAFLNFLWTARGGKSWRDATETDHTAYLVWRRRDERGPRVDGATWDREVAAVHRFYKWQVKAGNVRVNPIPQREARVVIARVGRRSEQSERPATYSHGAGRDRVEWLPAASYRRWRDIGVRGYGPDGLPTSGFRGRWAARNTTFCDLMVRTGMRLSEQSALSLFEIPLGCRWIAVRHADDHIHLVATLVSERTGRRVYPRNDFAKLREACQQLEKELGLTPTPDIDWTAARHPTRREVGKAERIGRGEPARVELRRVVSQAAAAAQRRRRVPAAAPTGRPRRARTAHQRWPDPRLRGRAAHRRDR